MSQFTFFADVLTALGGAIEKDKKKTKPEGTKIPFRSGLSETNGQVPSLLDIPKSDIQQDIELGIVDRNINMPIEEMVTPAIQQQVPNIATPSVDRSPEPPELLRRIPQYERRFDDPQAGIVQPDGRMGTHQMASEVDPETGLMTAFPMIVKMPDGKLKQFEDKAEALKYNKSINNVRTFYNDQDGIDYAAGGYKQGTALAELTPVQQFNQQFGGVPDLQVPPAVKPVRYQSPPQTKPDVSGQLFDKNTTRGKGQSQFDYDVQETTAGMNADVLYDRAVAPLVFGGLPDKGGMKAIPVPGTSFVNKAYGYFTDSKEEEAARDVAEKAREYFNNDNVRQRIVNDPEALYMLGKDPIGYYKALTGNKVEEFKSDLPVAFEPGVPEVTTTEVPEVSALPVAQDTTTQTSTDQGGTTQQQVDASNQAVTNNNIISDPNNQEAKTLIDNAVDETLITEDFPRLMPGEGSSQQTIEETFNQEVLDNKGNVVKDPKKSFLSKLWDGVKDVVVTQFKDPANQRALFAYAVSRALGYDGVTLASQVLANEWEQKAATTKHERELERIYGKEKIAAMKKQRENQTIDYSKPVVLYNADQNQNVTVYLSKDNQSFTFGTGDTQPYSIQSLLSKGYTIGEGLDFEDQRQVLTDFMLTDAETITGDLIDELNANEDIKPGVRQGIIKQLNNAKSPYVIREAMVAFTNKYGKTADYNSSDVQAMASRGIQNYLRAVSEGRAKGSKDLIGYMDYEALTYDISKTNIPEAFFSIAGNPEQEIGVNGWSRTNNVVGKITNNINSRLGKGSYTEADIYGVLSDEFLKEFGDGTNKFATYWTKASKNTSDKKAEAVSPAMLWIQGIVSGQEASPDYKSPSLKEVLDMLADRKKS